MRYATWIGCGLWAAALAVTSCGGSSSETPWPVEPDTSGLDPVGERGRSPAAAEPVPPADAGPPARRNE